MARTAEFYATVGDGPNAQSVGYSSTKRGLFLGVRFTGPEGNRIEKTTKCTKKDADYHTEAARFIIRAFAQSYEKPPEARSVIWDDAMKEVEAMTSDLRPATIKAFKKSAKQLQETLRQDEKTKPKPAGPGDINPELATRFSRVFLSTTYTRGKSGIDRKRSPVTLSYYLRSLSALWGQFLDLGFVSGNPWASVRRPKLEKKQKYVPTKEEIDAFFGWIYGKYPQWERLHALLRLKLLSGCRTADICQLKTAQLQNGHLRFHAHQTKTKEDRDVPLDDELSQMVRRVAGKTWLWEKWNDDCKKFRPSSNDGKLSDKFSSASVDCVLRNIFREYSDAESDRPRLTPHAFRRYAITAMVTATGNVDLTALSLGVSPQTARTYYLAAQRAFNTEDAFKLAASLLKPLHQIPTESGYNGEQNRSKKNNQNEK